MKLKQVQSYDEVFKIGHTTSSVAQRIKNAKKQSTYLFGDVEVVATFRCYNILTLNLEHTIHEFFDAARLNIDIIDNSGKRFRPQEWFCVKFDAVSEAIDLILTGNLHRYYYDMQLGQIVKK